MRTIAFILCFMLVQLSALCAPDRDTSSVETKIKSGFYSAKDEIEKMLNGEQPLSYERAVFLTENAYWEDQLDAELYRMILDMHTARIKGLFLSQSRNVKPEDFTANMYQSAAEQYERKLDVLRNWAIYTYMTDTVSFARKDGSAEKHLPYDYSYEDPLATSKWENSQVIHLLDEGRGNCYAMVSLYKIFADRLSAPAAIATVPGHVFIRHKDERGVSFNVELATRAFPGSGSIETLTYTTEAAVKSGIAMRELDAKQSVGLCLIYLAKGYESKFGSKDEGFVLSCSELALHHDPKNLSAMLLKAEAVEESLLRAIYFENYHASFDSLLEQHQADIVRLYELGYREMPAETKEIIFSRIRRVEGSGMLLKDHSPKTFGNSAYVTLSRGLYEEVHRAKELEKFSRTVFDVRAKKIIRFEQEDSLDSYQYDPVAFALSVDPLQAVYPNLSPYGFVANTPINAIDPDGRLIIFVNGFLWQDPDNIPERKEEVFTSDKHDYWDELDNMFMSRVEDHNVLYADGSDAVLSTAVGRYNKGIEAGKDLVNKIKEGKIVLQKNDKGEIIESIKLVAHSQGTAYSAGIAKALQDVGAEMKIKIEVSYNIAPKQPSDINMPDNVDRVVQYGSVDDKVANQTDMPDADEVVRLPKDQADRLTGGHRANNYGWIFTRRAGQEGYVARGKDRDKVAAAKSGKSTKLVEIFKNRKGK